MVEVIESDKRTSLLVYGMMVQTLGVDILYIYLNQYSCLNNLECFAKLFSTAIMVVNKARALLSGAAYSY
jgi:hypothetical protein